MAAIGDDKVNTAEKRVTITEVAKEAGVSKQTVSRVINDRPDVASATRQRVLDVIHQLGYQPNSVARSLIRGRSFTLGVIGYGLEYYGPSCTLVGIEQEASNQGYTVLLNLIRQPESNSVKKLLGEMLSRQVDGIIWAVPEIGKNRTWIRQDADALSVPIVFLSMASQEDQFVVAVDNHAGGLAATRHLIALGCQNIGLITGPLDWWEARQRKQGWQEALMSVGLLKKGGLAVEGNWEASSGERGLERLLSRHPEIDGLFVCNDRMALGAFRAARRLGRCVPEDLPIVGFDDIPNAAYFYPSLTTVRQDMVELGRRAVQELGRAIEAHPNRDPIAPKTILLQPKLIVRESSVADVHMQAIQTSQRHLERAYR